MIFGLIAMIPIGKYQRKYMHTYHRIKAKPQEHINRTYEYVEKVENSEVDNPIDDSTREKTQNSTERKP